MLVFSPVTTRQIYCGSVRKLTGCSYLIKKKVCKIWRQENIKKQRSYRKKYKFENRLVIAITRKKYYVKNREKLLAVSSAWKKKNRETISFYQNMGYGRKNNAPAGGATLVEWIKLKNGLGNKCIRCGVSGEKTRITVDHITPSSLGGTNNIKNLQPLCIRCNSWKHRDSFNYIINPLPQADIDRLQKSMYGSILSK